MNRRHFLGATALTLGALASGSYYWQNRWEYIVIHHSAGNYGDIEFLQQVHRERQKGDPIDAIPYHYVIGNGNGLGLGQVASDWRQQYHLWGTHVSGRNRDRNFRGLGICLVGNFDNQAVPEQQYQSLLTLIKQLQQEYNIPKTHINGHGHTPGERTRCPGKHFPMQRLMSELVL